MKAEPSILLTNDDGIDSPGLWAAAAALAKVGTVTVVAPQQQYSGAGRSLPPHSDGVISPRQVQINGTACTAYGVGGSPAQAVLHGLLEILPRPPTMVVSGINYGENVGTGVTISGTIGAALEAAARGIPALAVSLETDPEDHRSYSTQVDFSAAAHFTLFFAQRLFAFELPLDVDILKVEVPAHADAHTPWAMTRLSRQNYYDPIRPLRTAWEQPRPLQYIRSGDPHLDPQDTDVYSLRVKKVVAVTPLSLDLTSRVDLAELERCLRVQHS
jgi:5'-nucleotidase